MTLPVAGVGIEKSEFDIFQKSANLVEFVKPVILYGHNNDIDTGTLPEAMIPWGGTYSFPSAAGTISVVSGSVNDASAGTGARTVTITGLDSNWDILEEVVTLNGTTPVVTTGSFLRVNKIYTTTVGSGGVNAGTLTFTHSNTSATCATIESGEGCSHASVYSVPNNYTMFVANLELHLTRQTAATVGTVKVYRRNGAGGPLWQCFEFGVSNQAATFVDFNGLGYFAINEKSDFYLQVDYVSGSNTAMSSLVRGYIVRNDILSNN